MENVSKDTYQRQLETSTSKALEEKSGALEEREIQFSQNPVNTLIWLAFLAAWIMVYHAGDQTLSRQMLPALLITTCLMFLKSLDRQGRQ